MKAARTVAVGVAALLCAVGLSLWIALTGDTPLQGLTRALSDPDGGVLTVPMIVLTYLGTDYVLVPAALLLAGTVLRKGRGREAAWLVATVVAARVFGLLAKVVIAEDRPPLTSPPAPLHVLDDYSYPSGHALMSVVVVGAMIATIRHLSPNGSRRVIAVGALFIAGVDASRVYLGFHWVGDVIGGFLYGVAILCIALLLRRRFDFDRRSTT